MQLNRRMNYLAIVRIAGCHRYNGPQVFNF
jgi:hypothetical protein